LDVAPSQEIAIESIYPSPHQPRTHFDAAALTELARSIEQYGILEPLLVRATEKAGVYELIAGERRLRAARMVPLEQVPVNILAISTEEAAQIALVENLQREDLNPIEETEGLLKLLALRLELPVEAVPSLLYRLKNQAAKASDESSHNVMANPEAASVEAIFQGVARISWHSFVKNRLPLLKLPEDILEAVRSGQLAYSKATAITRVKDAEARGQLLETALQNDLSLTQIRAEIQALQQSPASNQAEPVNLAPPQRLQRLSRSAKQSKAFDDPKKKRRVIKLLDELETLLKD
jgi:ParB family chromosome partitioning protein